MEASLSPRPAKKTAIILFNLGGPDNLEAVRPFLYNLFNDPAILRLPRPFRQMLAWFVSTKRHKFAQEIYAKIGGRSPILENTEEQARALENALKDLGDVKCFVAMRYWNPFVEDAVDAAKAFAPEQIILLPLYPQFSTTTTASSFKSWYDAAKKQNLDVPTRAICCYPCDKGFVTGVTEPLRVALTKTASFGKPRVLFSAHGLPEKIVKAGDPYASHCELTVSSLVEKLGEADLDYVLCYQSRVGPLKWIGPATDDEIRRAGRDKVPLIVVPIAFVSEHSETLVELDIEYRHLAETVGVPNYERLPVVGTDRYFVEGLARIVRTATANERDCVSSTGGRLCGNGFSGCPVKA